MRIISNLMGLNTLRNKNLNANGLKSSFEKLSSGFDINRAADNASGLAISEKMRGQIREMEMCETNVQKGIALADTADGALGEVSDLLKRAREICVQASNGTYQDEDRAALNKELGHLMEEIDRIASSTHYNNIYLFTDKTGGLDWNKLGNEIKDFYEIIKPSTDTVEFGKWDRVSNKPFDLATPPKLATATINFDDSVDISNMETFAKKTFTSFGVKYYLHDTTTGAVPSDVTNASMRVVSYSSATDSAQALMSKISSSMSTYETGFKCELTADNKGMKVTAPARNFDETLNNMANFPNNQVSRPVLQGDGAWANGQIISSKDGANPLGKVFSYNVNNDRNVLKPMTGTSTAITPMGDKLTADEAADLAKNTFTVSAGTGGTSATINFVDGGTATGDNIALKNSGGTYKTRTEIWSEISRVASGLTPSITINVNPSDGKITASGTATDTNGNMLFQFGESTFSDVQYLEHIYPGTALGVTLTNIKPGTAEFYAEDVVSFPADMTSIGLPTTVKINGVNITLYNSSSTEIKGTLVTGSGYYIDVKNKTQDQIMTALKDRIVSITSPYAQCKVEGNKVRIESLRAGPSTVTAAGVVAEQKSREELVNSTTNKILMNNTCYGERTFEFPITFPTKPDRNIDIDALDKTGFAVGGRKFEFGKGTQTNPDTTFIKLEDPMTTDKIKDAISAAVTGLGFQIDLTTPDGTILLSKKVRNVSPDYVSTAYSNSFITNGLVGEDGLFSNDTTVVSATLEGGTKTNQPQTVVDFSGIDNTNKGSLLGKGFRITCASCPSEYINIFFRNDNTENPVPPFFDMIDNTGVNRVIKNMVVDLKDINSGEDIVKDIVQKLTPKLDHFTEVAVGNPADQLVVLDKRSGDYKDPTGVIRRAEVLTGVKTNFSYDVALGVPGESPNLSGNDDNSVLIYVGSKPTHQYIPIDLPVFNSELLKLRDPDLEVTTRNQANEGIAQVDLADEAISSARGTIGAAKNRLETAFNSLSNGAIQLTASESKIRDLDVAKETLNLARRQILDQMTTALMAQANQIPQSVLELLK